MPQFGDDLFRRVLLPWHVLILFDAIRLTSSRATSVGADQLQVSVEITWVNAEYAAHTTHAVMPMMSFGARESHFASLAKYAVAFLECHAPQ